MLRAFIALIFVFSVNNFAKDHNYKIDGEDFEGFILNQGKDTPLVLIIHDWDGLGDYEKKRAQMLKKQGFSVFAMDMYGKGIRPQKVEDKKKRTTALYKDRATMRKLMEGGIAEAKRQGLNIGNAVIVGYCFGGTSVLELARSGEKLKGFVSFHGNLDTPKGQNYDDVKGSIMVFHGTADKIVPMTDFADLAARMESAGVNHEMITYSGAPHAFSVFGSDRYRKKADQLSWARFSDYLKE